MIKMVRGRVRDDLFGVVKIMNGLQNIDYSDYFNASMQYCTGFGDIK